MRLNGFKQFLFCSYFITLTFLTLATTQLRAEPPPVDAGDCAKLLLEQRFVRGMFSEHQSALKQLKKSEEFHQFCADNNFGKNCEALANEEAIFGLYGAYVLQKVKDLETTRTTTLLNELKHHGLHTSETDGYQALAKLSEKNLKRLSPKSSSTKNVATDFLISLDRAIETLDFGYVHNASRDNATLRTSPTLSTRLIVRFGFGVTLNTVEFNTKILQSEGNVFFHVVPKLKDDPTPNLVSRYGQYTFKLSSDFARKYGWVSPFIMIPLELADLYPKEPSTTNKDLAQLVKKLSATDFTVDDILDLIKATVRNSILELWKVNASQAEATVKGLADREQLQTIVKALGMRPLGFVHGLELKVPLFVPQNELGGEYTPPQDPSLTNNGFIDLRTDSNFKKPKPAF